MFNKIMNALELLLNRAFKQTEFICRLQTIKFLKPASKYQF